MCDLKTSVRRVQRWEKDEGLPVHRHAHAPQDTVYVYSDEIDQWCAIYLKYKDGREEIARAGDLWHAPPGHTAWCNEDSKFIEFSPQHEFATLLDHLRKEVQASSR